MRSTPGVVFQGHQRPSTVMGKVAENNQVGNVILTWTSSLGEFALFFEILPFEIVAGLC